MLNIKFLDCVSNARNHEMTDTQPLINTVRQGQLRFLGHIATCSNSWQKETRATRDKLHIVYIQKLLGDTRLSASRCNCLASFRSLFLEKICSHLLRSRMVMMMMMIPPCPLWHHHCTVHVETIWGYPSMHDRQNSRHNHSVTWEEKLQSESQQTM